MTHDYPERLFLVLFHEKSKSARNVEIGARTRRCSTLDNAVISATKWAQSTGMIGDTIEVVHEITKKQLATVRVTLRGLDTKRHWEREVR